MKTKRGYERIEFEDSLRKRCILQESSSLDPHVWLGVPDPELKILAKAYNEMTPEGFLGKIKIEPYSKYNKNIGWCDIKIPEEVGVFSMMHLNRDDAKQLADALLAFYYTGNLPSSEKSILDEVSNHV